MTHTGDRIRRAFARHGETTTRNVAPTACRKTRPLHTCSHARLARVTHAPGDAGSHHVTYSVRARTLRHIITKSSVCARVSHRILIAPSRAHRRRRRRARTHARRNISGEHLSLSCSYLQRIRALPRPRRRRVHNYRRTHRRRRQPDL